MRAPRQDRHVPGHRPGRGRMRRRRRGGPVREHRHGERARTPWSPMRRSRSRRSSTRSWATPTTPWRSRPPPTSRSSSRSAPREARSTWRCVPAAGHGRRAGRGRHDRLAGGSSGFDIAELEALFGEYLLSLGEFEGEHYGLPTNVNLKSMVWYPKDDFDAAGYTVPDDLRRADGAVATRSWPTAARPGASASSSGGATGWPATDWMEDIMLRTAGVGRLRPVGHARDPVQRPGGR